MSKTKKIVIQQNNGIDYDKLYPQVDAYSKNETLTNNTSQMFRINNGTPDQILQYLGKYCQYWWKREIKEHWQQNRQSKSGVIESRLNVPSGSGHGFSYSNEVTYNSDSTQYTARLLNYTDTTIFQQNFSTETYFAQHYILGKYICFGTGGAYKVYYIPANATLSYSGSLSNTTFSASSYEFISYTKIASQFDGYVQSNNRNAYPDSGEQDGYNYTYLGVPLANAALLKISDKI